MDEDKSTYTDSLKRLLESTMSDLTNNESLEAILLKVQVISFNLKNDLFSQWFNNEKDGGYETIDELPVYRKVTCPILGDIGNGAGMFKNHMLTTDGIADDFVREHISDVFFYESIIEIENFSKSNSSLKKPLQSSAIYHLDMGLNPGWNIINAWHQISPTTCKLVVEAFKSRLLQFILELNEKLVMNINFNVMEQKKEISKIIHNTINAGVVSTGENSSIAISNSEVFGGKDNVFNFENSQLKEEVTKAITLINTALDEVADDQDEITSEIARINIQLNKDKPKLSIIKSSFETLRDIFAGIVSGISAPYALEGIKSVLHLLGS